MAFAGYLKQSTAVDILIGPFLDDTDGKTAETGLTLDVEVSKNGQALANKSDATAPTHDAAGDVDGYYNCELDTTDTGTLGLLTVVAHAAGFLPVRLDFQIVVANWYDTMCSTENLDVNVKEVSDDTTAADNLELACDNYSAARGLAGTALPAAAADAAGGLPISDAGGLDLDGMATNINDIETDTNELQADWVNGGRLDLILDELTSQGDTNEGKIDTLDTNVDSIVAKLPSKPYLAGSADTDGGIDATEAAVVQSECNDALVAQKLDHLVAVADADDPVNDSIVAKLASSDGDWSGYANSTDSLEALTGAIATLNSLLSSILADTHELQTDWVNGGRLDLLVDAIKAVTDALPDSGALTDIASNAEAAADFLNTDTIAEMAQGAPPDTPTVAQAIMYPYMSLINKSTTTDSEVGIYNAAGTKIADAALNDDDTTFTKSKFVSGA